MQELEGDKKVAVKRIAKSRIEAAFLKREIKYHRLASRMNTNFPYLFEVSEGLTNVDLTMQWAQHGDVAGMLPRLHALSIEDREECVKLMAVQLLLQMEFL